MDTLVMDITCVQNAFQMPPLNMEGHLHLETFDVSIVLTQHVHYPVEQRVAISKSFHAHSVKELALVEKLPYEKIVGPMFFLAQTT